ncbi:MAG: M23 family metallopeptidase [Leucobacter sp.]
MPTPTPVNDAPAYPTRRSLRERSALPVPESELPVGTDSIRVPLVEHVPAVALSPASEHRRKPLRRRLAGVAAAASVCGLTLTLALPFTHQASTAATGDDAQLSSQRLFSEVSLDDMPSSFAEVSASIADASAPTSYVFQPDALVNYPFFSAVTLTDGFGYRTAPVEQFHDAQDFAAAAGTPVHAIADGTVLEAGFASDGCGFGLKLEHELDGAEVTSRYCHMEMGSHSLEVGDVVRMGDEVGSVGNTGMSFGPHLHLAIRVDDEPVDPLPFFQEYTRKKRSAEATGAKGASAVADAGSSASSAER